MIVLLLMTSSLAALTVGADPPGGYYTTRYDHLDVENILNQKRLVYYYTECLLDRGPCTPQGIEFKRILPEALRTNCLRCTEKQRFVTMKTIRRLKKEYPDVWAQLAEIWDPTGAYYENLEESVNKKFNRSPETTLTPTPTPLALANGDSSNVQNLIPSIANRFADKPISFSSTTIESVASSPTPTTSTTTSTTAATTSKFISTPIQSTTNRPTKPIERSTKTRLVYNYDFAATSAPPVQKQTGISIVLRGVNNIIAPISDIAGKVINAGSDFAGMVLNVLGVRKITA